MPVIMKYCFIEGGMLSKSFTRFISLAFSPISLLIQLPEVI